MKPLSVADLVEGFRELGLRPGMSVMVHSSLKSLVRTEEGPKTVVDALREALTDEGTLMMPSFNHGAPFGKDSPGYYSSVETGTTNGAIPDFLWRQPGVLRTLNPTHAFAAWGRKAREYLKDHHRTVTMGPDSPLGRLWRDDGVCLLIGVDYGPNTFKHAVEMINKVPCLGIRTEAYPVKLADGRMVTGRTWGWRERACPISDPARYAQAEMQKHGLETRGTVGPSPCILYRLDDFYRVVSGLLAEGIDGHPPCSECPIRPRKDPTSVESDWDFENDRLKPDSEAWTYEDGL